MVWEPAGQALPIHRPCLLCLAAHLRKLWLDAGVALRVCESTPQVFHSLESLTLMDAQSLREIVSILACAPALREVDLYFEDCRGIHQLWSVADTPAASAGVVGMREECSLPATATSGAPPLVALTTPRSLGAVGVPSLVHTLAAAVGRLPGLMRSPLSASLPPTVERASFELRGTARNDADPSSAYAFDAAGLRSLEILDYFGQYHKHYDLQCARLEELTIMFGTPPAGGAPEGGRVLSACCASHLRKLVVSRMGAKLPQLLDQLSRGPALSREAGSRRVARGHRAAGAEGRGDVSPASPLPLSTQR